MMNDCGARSAEQASRLLVVMLAVITTVPLFAAPVGGQDQSAPSSGRAAELLERVSNADRTPYRSRQIVAYFGEPQSNALLDVRSSDEGRYVRAESGGEVTRMWAHADVGVVDGEPGAVREAEPATVRVRPDEILEKYAVEVGPSERALGANLVPLVFVRRRDRTMIERWLVHERSGVVYQRSLFDAAGKVVGMSTVVEMHWGDPGPEEPMGADLGRAQMVRASEARGAPEHLAGSYDLWRSYELDVDGRPSEQWVYSDGLHALSIFRTPGALRSPKDFTSANVDGTRVWRGPGPGTWAWEGGGATYLVVAEEPAIEISELIEPLPKGGRSVWARFGSVWSRIGRLFD